MTPVFGDVSLVAMQWLLEVWKSPALVALISAIVTMASLTTALHALLYKRDPRAATGWIGLSLLAPVIGPLMYFFFGINRIHTRARKLHGKSSFPFHIGFERPEIGPATVPAHDDYPEAIRELVRVGNAVCANPLVSGNAVRALHNGEQCYPEMLAAIDGARTTVYLATYIFESNATGQSFADALARARERGVDVRVLIDGVGELYSWPRVRRQLVSSGVQVARFLPPRLFPPAVRINLRNHRKLLIVDHEIAFTGGMNIGDRHLFETGKHRVRDVHFRLEGTAVEQLETAFQEDWAFCTGEDVPIGKTQERTVEGDSARNSAQGSAQGSAQCRVFTDGPNEDLDQLITMMDGAIASARRRVWIMTPYFLPPAQLTASLQTAALRGVDVRICLPAENNLPFVHWATRNMLASLIQRGVRVGYQPAPFAHSKLFLVDDDYVQIGSANIDPRSLRLNFELGVEIFDREFNASIAEHFEQTLRRSRLVTLEELDGRPLLVRLRDSFFWLFSPYL